MRRRRIPGAVPWLLGGLLLLIGASVLYATSVMGWIGKALCGYS